MRGLGVFSDLVDSVEFQSLFYWNTSDEPGLWHDLSCLV